VEHIVGNTRAKEILQRMLAARRVPGALLFAGPEGVGKRLFALELAKALNCHTLRAGLGCGACAVCRRIVCFNLPATDDRDAHRKIIWSEHADVGLILPYNRYLLVDAARELDHEAHYRPYEGAARVFIVEAADKFNEAAANALLKTLEEPPATTHIILLTTRPAALLPTIRSRCQALRFAALTCEEIENHLLQEGRAGHHDAALLARLAQGSLGRALALDVADYRARRNLMLEVLKALTTAPDRVRLLRISEELTDAKHKDKYESYLDTLTLLARDVWALTLAAPETQLVNADLRAQLKPISQATASRRAARWLTEIAAHIQRLNVNINRKVATDALLLSLAQE
jgi:DNA polymerase-3 subunit delta'